MLSDKTNIEFHTSYNLIDEHYFGKKTRESNL
jgi:hypothetical protein